MPGDAVMLRPALPADFAFIRSLAQRADYAPFITDEDEGRLRETGMVNGAGHVGISVFGGVRRERSMHRDGYRRHRGWNGTRRCWEALERHYWAGDTCGECINHKLEP